MIAKLVADKPNEHFDQKTKLCEKCSRESTEANLANTKGFFGRASHRTERSGPLIGQARNLASSRGLDWGGSNG